MIGKLGVRLIQKLIKTSALQRHGIEEISLAIPECAVIEDHTSDAYYEINLPSI